VRETGVDEVLSKAEWGVGDGNDKSLSVEFALLISADKVTDADARSGRCFCQACSLFASDFPKPPINIGPVDSRNYRAIAGCRLKP